jgi:hypothetical protein
MQGRPAAARSILLSLKINEKNIRLEDKAVLTATWGLLHFRENDFKAGIECYQRAETIAFGSLQKNLPRAVRQKMHLELARAFLRLNDLERAKSEIQKGLAITLYSLSFALQVRVRGRMPKRTQHGDHLAFVVERVRDHVKHNKCRTIQFSEPSFRTFRQRRIQLFLTESL